MRVEVGDDVELVEVMIGELLGKLELAKVPLKVSVIAPVVTKQQRMC